MKAQIVQYTVVEEEVEPTGDVAQVREVVHDEVNLHTRLVCPRPRFFHSGFSVVYAGHVEAFLGKIDRIFPCATAEVNGAARLDAPAFYQRYEFHPGTNVPRCAEVAVDDLIEQFHRCLPDDIIPVWLLLSLMIRNGLTAGVSRKWAERDSAWEQYKPKARKMPVKHAESLPSAAHLVGCLATWPCFTVYSAIL